jgi:heme/copper-type cytochrome/quinol oxidase subunit 2
MGRCALTGATAAAAILVFVFASGVQAADVKPGYGGWWLPPDHSEHGYAIDQLFNWIFWITMVTFVVVEVVLLVFLVKYRARKDRAKARFTHGNTRLEMAWTIAPAVILAVLALASKKVWDNYRYAPFANDPNRAQIMVIGQQFKWNRVYPGPDKKLGRYMLFPKPTDLAWPNPSGDPNKSFMFAGVPGPAFLPQDKAVSAINTYIDQVNPLGKDYTDPDGKDDSNPGDTFGEIVIPKGRPVEIVLGSKDVIHDFFLPNFRVKLDAVPGMRGHIYFTATETSRERELESRREYTPDQLAQALKDPANKELTVSITEEDKANGAEFDTRTKQWLFRDNTDPKKPVTIIRNGMGFTEQTVQKLKGANIPKVHASLPGYWELVCEELCGQGHYTMRGVLRVVDADEYQRRFEPTPAPKVALGETR